MTVETTEVCELQASVYCKPSGGNITSFFNIVLTWVYVIGLLKSSQNGLFKTEMSFELVSF